MIITAPEPEARKVDDYDIMFTSGQAMSLRVDPTAGDFVDWTTTPMAVRIVLAAKPSKTQVGITLPEEEITIFLGQVLSIQKRALMVTPLNDQQKLAWEETLKGESKLVH